MDGCLLRLVITVAGLTSKGLKQLNYQDMKNFIKRTIDRICRKPLLVKPVVSESLKTTFINCNWIQIDEESNENDECLTPKIGDTFTNCTFLVKKGMAAINFR